MLSSTWIDFTLPFECINLGVNTNATSNLVTSPLNTDYINFK